ncbi:FxDxF family PEP-CTERM protein [Xylophilus sp. GOD-11R]|uniref:FxDxF family PEP-CTERM protein n=1 Tax=Xylophilus sp. GOD-11R TaxID=3089814 RepID=UPI00298C22FC|nr:FxDxF family PEP-CTERM protein [Xylophilus sp. GOD-11R]WPB58575.1 FxDxF family PEP-CTERM protein [Xylophilus sp. GOD-11R]
MNQGLKTMCSKYSASNVASKIVSMIALTCAGFGATAAGLEQNRVNVTFESYDGSVDFGTQSIPFFGAVFGSSDYNRDIIFISPEYILFNFFDTSYQNAYNSYIFTNLDGDFPTNFTYDEAKSNLPFSQSRISSSGNTLTISLYGYSEGAGQVVLSTVSAVPEPETYAMLLAGMGLIGAIARRRSIAKRRA